MISVVMPVYNSSSILEESILALTRHLDGLGRDYEILCRDDKSTDNSLTVLKSLEKKYISKVRVYCNPENRGLGHTLRELFKDTHGDIIIYVDADAFLCFNLDLLSSILSHLEEADVVVASRYNWSTKKDVPLMRRFFSALYDLNAKLVFGLKTIDLGSGLLVLKKKVIENVHLQRDGFGIHLEMFLKIQKAGFKFVEVPVGYKHWEGGSFRILKHGPKTILETIIIWLENR
jgi:glycosyltransferase involved in cell wall biosynthesis